MFPPEESRKGPPSSERPSRGALLSIWLFLSGLPIVLDIRERGTVAEYSCFPYLVQICSTATWVVFCIEQYEPKFYWHFVSNVGGLIVTSAIFGMYLTYCSRSDRIYVLKGATVPIAIGIAWFRPAGFPIILEIFGFVSLSAFYSQRVNTIQNLGFTNGQISSFYGGPSFSLHSFLTRCPA